MAGPYSLPPLPNLRCSGLGVVPKKDGGWRVIYHLSAPHGSSINDYIDPARFSLHYCTIDAAITILNNLGPGSLMGKMDLKNAFRLMPVRKEDLHLLGIHWQGQWYVDKCLPFGLRSSPELFNMLADALQWIMLRKHTPFTTWMISSLRVLPTPTLASATWPPWPGRARPSMPLSSPRKRKAPLPPSPSWASSWTPWPCEPHRPQHHRGPHPPPCHPQ